MAAPPPPQPPPREKLVLDGVPPRLPLWRRILRWGLFLFLALANAALVAAVAGYVWLSRGLPDVHSLADYRPPVVTEMVSSDGQVQGELFE
jgi:penicillin-binding protein 1A